MELKTMKVKTGAIPLVPIISGILTLAETGGWFSQAELSEEIVGKLTNDHATGGIVGELEAQTGQSYPYLQSLRQEVVDAWRNFQRAAPWNKASTAEEYSAKVRELSNAVKQEAEAYQKEATLVPTLGKIPTALATAVVSVEWWKKYLPWMGVGTLAVVLMIVALSNPTSRQDRTK